MAVLDTLLFVPALLNISLQNFNNRILEKNVDSEYDYVIGPTNVIAMPIPTFAGKPPFHRTVNTNGHSSPFVLTVRWKDGLPAKIGIGMAITLVGPAVGGGSAGCVLASRLSENKDVTVLLLEAGGDDTLFNDIPLLSQHMQLGSMDWQYKTVPQKKSCLALTDRVSVWPRGKVIGGSSSINYMLYGRGNKRDYDLWEKLGNPGWSYRDVFPYFLKSEDFQLNSKPNDAKYHKKGGYLSVEFPKWKTPVTEALVQGAKELGYNQIDYNAEKQTGFNDCYVTTRDGSRCSAAKAFVKSVQHGRPNLVVSLNTFVEKILIDKRTKTATGVRIRKNGVRQTITARKEVILSSGSIASPQMLMLSGVGPRRHLEEMKIPVIHDSPGVGQNLQDHVTTFGLIFTMEKEVDLRLERMLTEAHVREYGMSGDGPLTVPGGLHGYGYFKTKYANASDDWPDIQVMMALGSVTTDKTLRYNFGINDEAWENFFVPHLDQDTITFFPLLMRPKSVGTIKLASKNPYVHPLIDPNYFEYEEDLNVLVEGTKLTAALGSTSLFKKMGAKLVHHGLPNCRHLSEVTDDYWRCLLTGFTMTDYKPACTCKMGPNNDPLAVLDSRLRVRGIKKLRVVDASVMPVLPTGPINAPTIMIAEKAADMIKEDNA